MRRYIPLTCLSMILLAGCAPVQVAPTNTALPTVTVTASALGIDSTMISDNDGMTLLYAVMPFYS